MNDPHDRVALRAGIPRFYVMNVWLAAAERQRTHGDLVNLSPGGWGGCWCRKFAGERAVAELQRIADAPRAYEKYRVSVLLANDEAEQTLTITHVLGDVRAAARRTSPAPAPPPVGGTRPDLGLPARLLQPAWRPPRRPRQHVQPDPGGLAARRGLRYATE